MPADVAGLRAHAAALRAASRDAQRAVEATTNRAALNLKNDLKREAQDVGSSYFKRVPFAISYDVTVTGDAVEAVVGPEIGRGQGSLAWIAYEGTATQGPRFPDPAGALEREATVFERFLADAAVDGVVQRL